MAICPLDPPSLNWSDRIRRHAGVTAGAKLTFHSNRSIWAAHHQGRNDLDQCPQKYPRPTTSHFQYNLETFRHRGQITIAIAQGTIVRFQQAPSSQRRCLRPLRPGPRKQNGEAAYCVCAGRGLRVSPTNRGDRMAAGPTSSQRPVAPFGSGRQ